MLWIILLFPFLEVTFSIWMIGELGFIEGVYWLLLAFFVGLALVRSIGLSLPMQLQVDMAQGKSANTAILRSALRFFAGVLLIVPGMLSDFVAAGLLVLSFVPKLDWIFRTWLEKSLRSRVIFRAHSQKATGDPFTTVINEDEFYRHHPIRDVTPLKPDELPESRKKD